MSFAMFVVGLLVGLMAMGGAWSANDKKSIERGYIMLRDQCFKLKLISLKEDEE
jgi:hypothetical protein